MSQQIEKQQELNLHGLDYIVTINSDENQLYLTVELKSTGETWKNVFMSNYIEEITAKTGNQKKFPVFIKMLLSAVQQQSDSVFIDILSFQDLEMLKSRKNLQKKGNNNISQNLSTQQSQASIQQIQMNNKRYVILTYCAEFDKVHYPLPLSLDENPSVDQLKNTILRLRIENEELKKSGFEPNNNNSSFISLRQENELNKQRIKKLEEINQKLHQNVDMSIDKNQIQELQQQISQKEKQIVEIKNQNLQLKNELVNNNNQENLVQQLSIAKDKFQEMDNIIQQLMEQLEEQKQLNNKQQFKIETLENELEGVLQERQKNSKLSASKKLMNNSQLRNSRISSIHSNSGMSNSKRSTSQPIKHQPSPMKFSRQASPKNSAKKNLLNTSNGSISKRKINSNLNISNNSIYSNKSNLYNRQNTPTKQRTSVMNQQTASSRNKQVNQGFSQRSPSPLRKSSASKTIRDQSPRNQILKPKSQFQYQVQPSPKRKISRSNSKNNLNSSENQNRKQSAEKRVISSYKRNSENNNNIYQSNKINKNNNMNNGGESDEEGRLLKKLQMLRQKNKENNSLIGNQNNYDQQQNQSNDNTFDDQYQNNNEQSFQQENINKQITKKDFTKQNKKQNGLDVSDIDQRLNNLSDLLKMAKQ